MLHTPRNGSTVDNSSVSNNFRPAHARRRSDAPVGRAALCAVVLTLAAGGAGPAWADSAVQDRFHRAYFLETNDRNYEAAAKLYKEVADDRSSPAELKSQAQSHLAACREELSSSDFAKLMPPNVIAYAQINRPGDQLISLVEKLGLLAPAPGEAGADGNGAGEPRKTGKGISKDSRGKSKSDKDRADGKAGNRAEELENLRRVAISPALIRELLGIRGAAVAVTGFDPSTEMPLGVVVFHPGNQDIVRGLIETALPIGGAPADAIEGYSTYLIENMVYVTLTSRLVVASTQPDQIAGVLRRLNGEEKESLASDPALAEAIKGRDGSLVFFVVNAKPIMPLIQGALAAGGTQSRELAIAQAVVDIDSLESVVGQAGVNDTGLFMDIAIRLDKGHHNLAYNFLRFPPVDQETLKSVPAGVAGFFVAALNEAPSQKRPTGAAAKGAAGQDDERPIVTALDIGREIFANIIGVAVFALPPDEGTGAAAALVGKHRGPPIPDVAAVLTVNDPAKSRALWTQCMGIASLATGAGPMEGNTMQIEGVAVQSFTMPEHITVYFATDGDRVVISPSKSAMTRTIAARRAGKSIVNDPMFSKSMSRIGPDSTLAVFAHPGRCVEIARQFMDDGDMEEIEPYIGMLSETVGSLVVEHSDRIFRISGMVSGLPNVRPLLSRLITEELGGGGRRHELAARAMAETARSGERIIKVPPVAVGGRVDSAIAKFDELALKKKDREAALAAGEEILAAEKIAPMALNELAWNLLTEKKYGEAYNELALRISTRSNELSGHSNWMFVDTLAWAKFKAGDVAGAIETERKALKLCGDDARRGEVEKALAKFEAAASGNQATETKANRGDVKGGRVAADAGQ